MKRLWVFAFIAISASFIFSVFKGPEDDVFQNQFNEAYSIFALNHPNDISFAGERMPLEQEDISERFDRELLVNTYWQSQTILFLKKAHKYFPIIEPILKEEGIPDDFKYLAIAESGLANVVSPSGATGFWQIMKSTGKERGLIINEDVDERYHLVKSTKAACKYLNDAYEHFGSWTLAAASYNMGITGLQKQMNRQEVNNYYDLLLNSETARYVFRIATIKEIISQPRKYGFQVREKDLYELPPVRKVILDSTVNNFADYAQQLGINYKILKQYNPWLRQSSLDNKVSWAYSLDIPEQGYFTSKNTVQTMAQALHEAVTVEYDTLLIAVDKKQDLKTLAQEYGVSLEELILWNIESIDFKVKKGQELKILN